MIFHSQFSTHQHSSLDQASNSAILSIPSNSHHISLRLQQEKKRNEQEEEKTTTKPTIFNSRTSKIRVFHEVNQIDLLLWGGNALLSHIHDDFNSSLLSLFNTKITCKMPQKNYYFFYILKFSKKNFCESENKTVSHSKRRPNETEKFSLFFRVLRSNCTYSLFFLFLF